MIQKEIEIQESERLRIEVTRKKYFASENLCKAVGFKHTPADGRYVCEKERIEYTDKSGGQGYYAESAAKSDGKTYIGEVFPDEVKVYILFASADGKKVGEFVERTKMTKWVKSHLDA